MSLFKEELKKGFENHMEIGTPIDYISFVGWTEPTLHPDFAEIVEVFYEIKKEYFPNCPTAVFSNSTTLSNSRVREPLKRFDRTFFKLDASSEKIFRGVNKPAEGVSLGEVVKYLELMSCERGDVELSSMVLKNNYRSLCSGDYLDIVRRIQPKDDRIYLCTPDWLVPGQNGNFSLNIICCLLR